MEHDGRGIEGIGPPDLQGLIDHAYSSVQSYYGIGSVTSWWLVALSLITTWFYNPKYGRANPRVTVDFAVASAYVAIAGGDVLVRLLHRSDEYRDILVCALQYFNLFGAAGESIYPPPRTDAPIMEQAAALAAALQATQVGGGLLLFGWYYVLVAGDTKEGYPAKRRPFRTLIWTLAMVTAYIWLVNIVSLCCVWAYARPSLRVGFRCFQITLLIPLSGLVIFGCPMMAVCTTGTAFVLVTRSVESHGLRSLLYSRHLTRDKWSHDAWNAIGNFGVFLIGIIFISVWDAFWLGYTATYGCLFFPRTGAAFWELDQVAASCCGAATLLFSMYDAYGDTSLETMKIESEKGMFGHPEDQSCQDDRYPV